MWALIRFEVRKLYAQKISLIGLLNIVLINVLFSLAFYLRRRRAAEPHEVLPEHAIGDFLNLQMYVQTILVPSTYMLFPMVLAIMGAYMLAGEMEAGNLRLMVFRPVSRWQIFLAKFVALSLYAMLMLAVLLVTSYVTAWLQLPRDGVVLIPAPLYLLGERQFWVLSPAEAPVRMLWCYVLAVPMLMGVSAMALMFGLVLRHYTASAVLTSTVYFCSYVIASMPLLSALHPFLPTRYWGFWKFAVLPEIPWDMVGIYGAWTAAYTAGFLAVGVLLFNARDL